MRASLWHWRQNILSTINGIVFSLSLLSSLHMFTLLQEGVDQGFCKVPALPLGIVFVTLSPLLTEFVLSSLPVFNFLLAGLVQGFQKIA